jgi:hypothetical protein
LKVLSILLYVASGFFFYATTVIGFVEAPSVAAKCAMIAIFTVPALILFAIGLACSPDRRALRDLGIVLTSSAGFSTAVVLSMVCVFLDPVMRKSLPAEQFHNKLDFLTGSAWIAFIGALGLISLFQSRQTRESH